MAKPIKNKFQTNLYTLLKPPTHTHSRRVVKQHYGRGQPPPGTSIYRQQGGTNENPASVRGGTSLPCHCTSLQSVRDSHPK